MKKLLLNILILTIIVGLKADWGNEEKVVPFDNAEDDRFGRSVSLSGDYAIIGAHKDDDCGNNSGSAYIFHKNEGIWVEQAKLIASDGGQNEHFSCYSVSISDDYAVISAPYASDELENSGAAYVFHRTGNIWSEQAKLVASDGMDYDYFGRAVSISGDYIAITARSSIENVIYPSAYIFHKSGEIWTEQAKLIASDNADYTSYGNTISISNNSVLLGSCADDENGEYSGAAYVFTRTGNTWSEQAKLIASDGESVIYFGYSVSISDNYAVVGSNFDGSAYIFYREGSTWTEQVKLTASNGETNNYFGCSVCISGESIIIGSYYDNDEGNMAGAAYLFHNDGINWIEQVKLTASDSESGDLFGVSVALDNESALIGASHNDDNGSCSGSSYFFEQTNSGIENSISEYQQKIILYAPSPNPFNPSTTIGFSINNNAKVVIKIYNIKGNKIKTLTNAEYKKGNHSIIWKGINDSGNSVSSGVYFYKLAVNGKTKAVKKCLMLK